MKEEYYIKYDYLKPDGYWTISAEEVFFTDIGNREEKISHDLAKKQFIKEKLKQFKKVRVTCCSYA